MLKRLILPLLLLTTLPLTAHAQEGPPAGGWRGGQGGGMGTGRGVGGTVTAISGTTIIIKTEDGDTYQILTSANSHIMKRVDRQPEPVKITDIHAGDAVMAGGEIDAKAKTVGAVFVMVLTPEQAAQAKKMREDFGKTWTAGEVTAIKDLDITIKRRDGVSQTVSVDENTSFKKQNESITLADIQVGDNASRHRSAQGQQLPRRDGKCRADGRSGRRRSRTTARSGTHWSSSSDAAVDQFALETKIVIAPHMNFRQQLAGWMLAVSLPVALLQPAAAQTAPTAQQSPPAADSLPPAPVAAGGIIKGSVKAGSVPLPGVSVTATNTLTGKKFTTTTDVTGAYEMTIPQNGRYVIRAELAAFALATKEALLNAASHDQQADFAMVLASRAAAQEQAATRQYGGASGAQSLALMGAASRLATGWQRIGQLRRRPPLDGG